MVKSGDPLPSDVGPTTKGIWHAMSSRIFVRYFAFFRLIFCLGHRQPNNKVYERIGGWILGWIRISLGSISRSVSGNPDSEIREISAFGIRNAGKFSCRIVNPGLWNLEHGFRNPDPTNDWNLESKFHCQKICNPVAGVRNPRCGIQNPRLS